MVPGSRSPRGVSRLQLLVAGLVVAGGIGLTALAGSVVVAVMAAVGALGGGTSLPVLLGLLVTVLLSGLAVAGGVAWLAAVALAQLRDAAASTHRRLLYWAYRRTRAFEEEGALGALLRPSRLFATRSDREGPLVTELKRRYVEGELDDIEFERELGRLLGDGASTGRAVRREVDVTAPDGGDDAGDDANGEAADGDGEAAGNDDRATDREDPEGATADRERERA